MHKEEYHLLFVLSEPPISVPQAKPHGWISGDVLVPPGDNSTRISSDRFLVLDVNKHGRAMALKLSKMSPYMNHHTEYIELGPKGLDILEPELGLGIPGLGAYLNCCLGTHLATYCIRLDKVYFEAMMTGKNHESCDVRVIGRLSPISMSKIVQFLAQQSVSGLGNHIRQAHTNVSDRRSSKTGVTLTDPMRTASHDSVPSDPSFEDFLASAYLVEQFLDFAYMAFDEVDYIMIREYLNLPKITFTETNILDCDCDDHKKKIVHPDDEGTRNFWRTLDKLICCAEKLKLDRDSSEILSHLNATSRAIGCQRISPSTSF